MTTSAPGAEAPTLPIAGLDRRFHALADAKRLRIVDLLRGGERCVCEIADALGLGQSLLSFHLKTLRDAGVVRDRRDGRWVHYSLDARTLEEMERFVTALVADGAAAVGRTCC